MPSVIQADLLKDASATKTLATLSSSAVTLHSDVTFPTKVTDRTDFYYLLAQDTDPKNYGNYYTTPDRGNEDTAVASAVVPAGYSSVVDAYMWWISNGYSGALQMQLSWSLSANSEAQGAVAQTYTNMASITATNDNMHRQSILDVGSTHWEDSIAQGDIIGFRIKHTNTANLRFIGISITWRF